MYRMSPDWKRLRQQMVEQQILQRGISDSLVLSAMRTVERHRFVPESMQRYACEDRPLPIGYDQTISQPFIVAFMTQALALKRTDRVLDVGTGSGYQAAILAKIVKDVYAIEIIPELAARAKENLKDFPNITIKQGDGKEGWPAYAPYDAILVAAAYAIVPAALIDQLAEGGRLILPVSDPSGSQELVLHRKKEGKITRQDLLAVQFVPLQ
jgi:protein-L-isoaspartate(D-aspartate) O-methyltransferase